MMPIVFKVAGALLVLILAAPAVILFEPGIVGGNAAEVVLTGSMTPTILAGDMVVLRKPSDPAAMKVGDVIAFRVTGDVTKPAILHRIIRVETSESGSPQYITQGDANNAEDGQPVLPHTIVGVYSFRVPYYGHLIEFAKSKYGILAFIVLPAIGVVINEVRKLNRADKPSETPAAASATAAAPRSGPRRAPAARPRPAAASRVAPPNRAPQRAVASTSVRGGYLALPGATAEVRLKEVRQ